MQIANLSNEHLYITICVLESLGIMYVEKTVLSRAFWCRAIEVRH